MDIDITQLSGLPGWAAIMVMAWRIAQLYLAEREKDRAFQKSERDAERAERATDRASFRDDVRHVLESSTSKFCLDATKLDALQKELQRIHDMLVVLTKHRIEKSERDE